MKKKSKKPYGDSVLPDQVQSLLSDDLRSGNEIFVFVVDKEANG